MTDRQFIVSVVAIFIILAIALAAHFKWLRGDSLFSRVVIFTAGLSTIALLRGINVPPAWFDGGKVGFGLAASFCAGAFIGGEGRWFRMPLSLGIGLPMLVFNILAHL